jgi:hypothetical protein
MRCSSTDNLQAPSKCRGCLGSACLLAQRCVEPASSCDTELCIFLQLSSFSAAAFNQIKEHKFDAMMKRCAARSLRRACFNAERFILFAGHKIDRWLRAPLTWRPPERLRTQTAGLLHCALSSSTCRVILDCRWSAGIGGVGLLAATTTPITALLSASTIVTYVSVSEFIRLARCSSSTHARRPFRVASDLHASEAHHPVEHRDRRHRRHDSARHGLDRVQWNAWVGKTARSSCSSPGS